MQLSSQILSRLLKDNGDTEVSINLQDKNLTAMFAHACYTALNDIIKILMKDSLKSIEKIEEILKVFEKLCNRE